MKQNINIYKRTVKNNVSDIKKILNALNLNDIPVSLYEKKFKATINSVTSRWENKEKYCRTLFVQKALGSKYPKNKTEISLSVDAMVNILDDFLDENLSKEKKEIYIFEFLRIFSVYCQKTNQKVNRLISFYINELITLAAVEKFYQENLLKEKNHQEINKKAINLLLSRGMDIDIFLQISFLNKRINSKETNKIKSIARIFRAINILKKDICDIDHDRENGMESVVTIILAKNKNKFKNHINDFINLLEERLQNQIKGLNKENFSYEISKRFQQMIKKEKAEILKLVNNY